jgi:biotin transport system substrate-specific component
MSVAGTWLQKRNLTEQITILVGANILLIACAQIRIPLWYTPIPITGQTFGVLLTGALWGGRYGALVVGMYLFEGMAGMPVFAGGRDVQRIVGPTGGFLISFIPAAFIAGYLLERMRRLSFYKVFLALLAANVVIYAIGLPWLAIYVGWNNTLAMGLLPFIPGDLIKTALAASMCCKILNKQ